MGRGKVIFGDDVLVDLTPDTVTPGTVFDGEKAHGANGDPFTGTFTVRAELDEQKRQIQQIKEALATKGTGTGKPEQEKSLAVTQNGNYEVLPDEGNTISRCAVDVQVPPPPGYADVSKDTVTAGRIRKGYTAHNAKGESITGTVPKMGFSSPQGEFVDQNGNKYPSGSIPICSGDVYVGNKWFTGLNSYFFGGNVVCAYIPVSSESEDRIFGNENLPNGERGALAPVVDKNLVPENIRKGATIFGVPGAFEGSTGPDTITPGETPILASWTGKVVTNKNAAEDTGLAITVQKAGTYRFKVGAVGVGTALGSDVDPQIFVKKNGADVSSRTVAANTAVNLPFDIACAAGDTVSVWAQAAGTRYSSVNIAAVNLVACIAT